MGHARDRFSPAEFGRWGDKTVHPKEKNGFSATRAINEDFLFNQRKSLPDKGLCPEFSEKKKEWGVTCQYGWDFFWGVGGRGGHGNIQQLDVGDGYTTSWICLTPL